ncbi:MAG: M55 family metallopeptidase [Armatimonadota bacterium]|nr:M55 family metallopeptidase [bacterium]MCS7309258.1 M55 family metallopeptidase [Armatimonadota bacterium]MDW8290574.1 M55 family metallopeptidase [Armatimonadota bacterium]
MIVWLCTDMEGISGIDSWDQCYHPDDNAPEYQYGREQLTADVNAAVAGCFDAGATEVRVIDGHGRNRNRGFIEQKLDPRATRVWISQFSPLRLEGLDETVHAVAMIGQHAMAGTLHGFIDHTQMPKEICCFRINGEEHGEMSQFALYAGAYGVPLVYVSGDEALCEEARRLFPHVRCTPTKRGTGWATCELYPPDAVRQRIRHDIAEAIRHADRSTAWKVPIPIEVSVEWAYSGLADYRAQFAGVQRVDARTVAWKIYDQRDIYTFPHEAWQPGLAYREVNR